VYSKGLAHTFYCSLKNGNQTGCAADTANMCKCAAPLPARPVCLMAHGARRQVACRMVSVESGLLSRPPSFSNRAAGLTP
jgi:hypothetical protein